MSATTGGINTQKSSKSSPNHYYSAPGGNIEVPSGMRFIPTPGTSKSKHPLCEVVVTDLCQTSRVLFTRQPSV
jgi:hypothetical protein